MPLEICTLCACLDPRIPPTPCAHHPQATNLSDAANVLHSHGLLEFAAAAGLCQPAGCNPFNWFDAFMTNNPGDQVRGIGCAGNSLKAVSALLRGTTKACPEACLANSNGQLPRSASAQYAQLLRLSTGVQHAARARPAAPAQRHPQPRRGAGLRGERLRGQWWLKGGKQ